MVYIAIMISLLAGVTNVLSLTLFSSCSLILFSSASTISFNTACIIIMFWVKANEWRAAENGNRESRPGLRDNFGLLTK